MKITEFLLARIAEDETTALAAVDGQADPENGWGYEGRTLIPHVGIIHHAVQAEHITRWHPYRVVAECAAKRAIIEQAERSDSGWWESIYVAILAAVYADHPDYQTEWKLDTPSEAG